MNKINPFFQNDATSVDHFCSVDDYSAKPYDKNKTLPYTKTRIILPTRQNLNRLGFCINLIVTATTMI